MLKDYESDFLKIDKRNALDTWFAEHPCDIDAVAYDPSQPQGETIGDKVNSFKDSALSGIFKTLRSNNNLSGYLPHWLSVRNLAVTAGVIATLYLYLWHKKQSKPDEVADEDERTAVSAQ